MSTSQPIKSAARKSAGRGLPGGFFIGLILAFTHFGAAVWLAVIAPCVHAQEEPPPNLAKLAAHRETETEAERNEYMYRQTVTLEELDNRGMTRGKYKETRDVIFSPQHERIGELAGKSENSLQNLRLTPEDFADIRDIQPLVLTDERLWSYETRPRGDETVDGIDCWVFQVRPRQILAGQRLFDGLVWIDKQAYNIVLMEGQAVPQLITTKSENLFPKFTTIRKPVDGKHWFPIYTYADDSLPFRSGPQRIRLRIAYTNYKRFGAESVFKPEPQ